LGRRTSLLEIDIVLQVCSTFEARGRNGRRRDCLSPIPGNSLRTLAVMSADGVRRVLRIPSRRGSIESQCLPRQHLCRSPDISADCWFGAPTSCAH